MKFREVRVGSIMEKPVSPAFDFVINPYAGCGHGCVYCSNCIQPGGKMLLRPFCKSIHYANFMKRFTGRHRLGGPVLQAKVNAPELIPREGLRGKRIMLSSLTDPYQPIEKECKITKRIIERLVPLQPKLRVLTKSGLVTRDFGLMGELDDCAVGVSVAALAEKTRREIEPAASPVGERVRALEKARDAGLKTFVCVSPVLPKITDCGGIVDEFGGVADSFFFESLDVQGVWGSVRAWLAEKHPGLVAEYERIYFTNNNYWDGVEKEIKGIAGGRDFHIRFQRGAK